VRVAWADPASGDRWLHPAIDTSDYVEDPYAANKTDGTTVRLGTAVGFIYGERVDTEAMGPTLAVGHRWGRLSLEAELDYLSLRDAGPSNLTLGNGERLGVVGRFDVIRLGPHVVGPNSMFAVYVEGGAASAWNNWDRPGADDPERTVPGDTRRLEGQVGAGILLDHRLQEPHGLKRIGWFLGWRVALAPHDAEPASICRGVSCSIVPMSTSDNGYTDRSMLFQSSLMATW
jgi:hypothetical protein